MGEINRKAYCFPEPWLLSVGVLQVHCASPGRDGVDRLAVSRGLLMCCRTDILLTPSEDSTKVGSILNIIFIFIGSDCLYIFDPLLADMVTLSPAD